MSVSQDTKPGTSCLVDGIHSLYLHIPFCTSRCRYCSFCTQAIAQDDPLMDSYIETLSCDLRRASKYGLLGNLRTIYIGGGTPTYLGQKRLLNLLYTISLYVDLSSVVEFSLEINPESFSQRLYQDAWALGVNRYSLGVQSFDDDVLRILGRAHDSKQALEAIEVLKMRDANISLDLMCGIPGQSADSWSQSVGRAVDFDVKHLSIYPLSIEDGTPFARAIEQGLMDAPDDDLQAEMMLQARDRLRLAGYAHYEIANYAKPGFESRHNLAYWSNHPYLGIGTSAASLVSLNTYAALLDAGLVHEQDCVSGMDAGKPALIRFSCDEDVAAFSTSAVMQIHTERLTAREAVCERCMLAMRTAAGLSEDDVEECVAQVPALAAAFNELVDEELLTWSSDEGTRRLSCSERGWLLGNLVFSRIWSSASPDTTHEGNGT